MASLPPALIEAIWLVATMRLALWALGAYVASERRIPHPCHFEEARAGWSALPVQHEDGLAFKLIGVWERWDGCWYAKIATFGYEPDGSTAFFPLYPLFMRAVASVAGDVVVAGMIVSAAASVFALWGLHRLVRLDASEDVARRTVFLVAIFPAAFFLLAPFTEALFLALAVWSLYLARRGAWRAAGGLGLLAALTRPVGVFLVLPLAWLALREARSRGARGALLPAAAALGPVAGAALYETYASAVVGRSVLDASRIWGSASFRPPWDVIGTSLDWTLSRGDPLQALNLSLLVGGLALFALGLRRLPVEQVLYAAPHLALLAVRVLPTPLTSTSRYVLIVFPLFVLLATLLAGRRARWSWAIASLLLLGLLAHAFARGDFVA